MADRRRAFECDGVKVLSLENSPELVGAEGSLLCEMAFQAKDW